MQKELNLDQAIAEISRRLKRHIGSNGTAHLPVSKDFAGFMTPELLSEVSTMWPQHNSLFSKRIGLSDGVDILSLKPGYYEGAKMLNHPLQPTTPTGWFSNVDVKYGGDGRKQFVLRDSITGKMWYRTIHTGGNVTSGTGAWVRQRGYVELWNGSSTLSSAVTLAAPLKDANGNNNYDEIEVVYLTQTGNYGHAYGSVGGVTINPFNNNNANNISALNFYETQLTFPTNTTAKLYSSTMTEMYRGETDASAQMRLADDKSTITIYKIWGIK